MMNKRIKTGGACILALALMLAGLKLPSAYAALPVDLTKTGEMEFTLAKNVYPTPAAGETQTSFDEDLKALELTARLYKVADISEAGAYTATADFQTLADEVKNVDSETTAEEWTAMAAEAAKIASGEGTYTATKAAGSEAFSRVTGMKLGLYLVTVDDTFSAYHRYSFNPYLISVPNNYYYDTDPKDDAWVYSLTGDRAVGLKPQRTERLGDLVINKNLTGYNASVGGAYFVYQVSVTRMGEQKAETNVYKLSFDGAGAKSLMLEDIPAGATVVVTEVYTGSSYELKTKASRTATITANPNSDWKLKEGETEPAEKVPYTPESVSFTNHYDGRQNGGSGVVNTFYYEDGIVNWKNDVAIAN